MTPLRFIFYSIAFAAILAVCAKIHGELPEGMHLATITVDTVVFRPIPTQALDSLDSVLLERARWEAFNKRRGKSDSK